MVEKVDGIQRTKRAFSVWYQVRLDLGVNFLLLSFLTTCLSVPLSSSQAPQPARSRLRARCFQVCHICSFKSPSQRALFVVRRSVIGWDRAIYGRVFSWVGHLLRFICSTLCLSAVLGVCCEFSPPLCASYGMFSVLFPFAV